MSSKPLLRAARGERLERPPVWMMRQAGRYLPEYHQTKDLAGGFLNLCKNPELAVEVTLQPIRRFGFDAAILFSDILIPAEAMGIELNFHPGPVIGNPIRNDGDVEALKIPHPEESLSYVLEILKGLKRELPGETTLIGFAGAPFTVASYLVEGASSSQGFHTIRRMLYERPDLADKLLSKLTQMTVAYLRAQIDAGAEIVQLFDSSASVLPPDLYHRFALSFTRRIIEELADTHIPVIYFAPGAMISLESIGRLGAHVIGIDFRIGLDTARQTLGSHVPVQGNLDPAALLGTPESVRRNVKRVLSENADRPGHIFNLGHGVLPPTPIENVEAMVDEIRNGVR